MSAIITVDTIPMARTVSTRVNALFLDREFCKDLCADEFMALVDADY